MVMQSDEIHRSAVIELGAFVEPGVILEENVCIGANAAVLSTEGNKQRTIVGTDAVIGANATIVSGTKIGKGAFVKPGAVVTRSVPPLAIVEGNPAIIVGYRGTLADSSSEYRKGNGAEQTGLIESKVSGVTFHRLAFISDLRGNLTVGEFERDVPFKPKRYFLVLDVPTEETRGEHAHHECKQFLICVRGECKVIADNGREREEFTLDSASSGLFLPQMIWGIQYKYSPDAVLLVFASHHYDSADYIREYDQFLLLTDTER